MKKIIVALAGALTLVSCGDEFLSKFPNTQVSEGNFYQTEDQMELAVNDCYRQLNRIYGESGICELYGELYSDNVWMQYYASSDPFLDNISRYIQQENNGYILDAWNMCYNAVYVCNNIIDKLERNDVEYSDGIVKNRLIGEAKAIRALIYFNMVRAWGAIPLPLTPISPEESYDYLREDPALVYQQIIDDLAFARDNLPEAYSGEMVGKVTKFAAMGILGKVYLTLGDKVSAATELKGIIDSGR